MERLPASSQEVNIKCSPPKEDVCELRIDPELTQYFSKKSTSVQAREILFLHFFRF